MDHSLDLVRKAKSKLEASEKAHIKVDKKLKETLAQLTEVEKDQKNVESALKSYKKTSCECSGGPKKGG